MLNILNISKKRNLANSYSENPAKKFCAVKRADIKTLGAPVMGDRAFGPGPAAREGKRTPHPLAAAR
jgi:hypothetical protein